MKHGHQRRIVVRVKPVDNSGKLALNLHSIVGVSVGSVVGRSKFQKPLDSFQDEGLSRVREEWASRVMVVKDRLDTAIHKPGLENCVKLSRALTTDRFENLNLTAHFYGNGL